MHGTQAFRHLDSDAGTKAEQSCLMIPVLLQCPDQQVNLYWEGMGVAGGVGLQAMHLISLPPSMHWDGFGEADLSGWEFLRGFADEGKSPLLAGEAQGVVEVLFLTGWGRADQIELSFEILTNKKIPPHTRSRRSRRCKA